MGNSLTKILLLIFFLALLTFTGLGSYYLGSTVAPKAKPSPTTAPSQPTGSTFSFSLPVSLTNPSVRWVGASYGFQGTITELKSDPQGLELVTTITGSGIPKFIVTKETQVVFTSKGQETPVSTSDLKPNKKVVISASYDFKKKEWTTRKVGILIENGGPATPSATPKQ